jgi:hypothetical protein
VTKAGNWDFVALNIPPEGRHLARLGDVIVEESATSGLLLAFQGTSRDAVYWCWLPRGSEVRWMLVQHLYSVVEHGALTTSTPASRDDD